jgi:5-methylthioadenosine/S-adenosylhomocysteine deaminase
MTHPNIEVVDLLIRHGLVVTMDPELRVLEDGSVAIGGNAILAVGPTRELEPRYRASRALDAAGCVVMPGLINAHTHTAMTLFRGLADDLPLMEWLEGYIFPVEAHLKGEWVRWGALLACAEMLLGGTTTFCDMYLFEEEVARAAKEAGMRGLLGEVLYDFPSPNYGPLEEGFRYSEELILRWRHDPLVRIAVEPHAAFTCSPELLRRARQLADRYRVPLIIHLSETRDEVERVRAQHGRTPVRHLDALGILDGATVADHVVWVDEEEMRILHEHRVGVVHNPESNMKLASGVAPVPAMLRLGMAVGIGTDGCASNNDLDLFREMDSAAKLHKAFAQDPTVMDARTVLKMATIEGARALGLEGIIGSLEPGKRADVVILDLSAPHLNPMYNVFSHLVYAAKGSDVRTVIVDGRVVVEERRLATLALDTIYDAVGKIAGEIRRLVNPRDGKR